MVEWKQIKDYEDYYISNDGRVISDKRYPPKEMKPLKNNGYLRVAIRNKNGKKYFRIHRFL